VQDETILQRIGDEFRRRRMSLRLSQEAFADSIEMHRAYYGAVERGEKNLQLSTIQRVSAGLGTSMWEIIREAETGAS
jgi:transcriptional regulator with XRE-family HTH domain